LAGVLKPLSADIPLKGGAKQMGISMSYDHPHYTVVRQISLDKIAGGSTSLVEFARFRCRTKALVRFVHVYCRSAPSAASGQVSVSRQGSIIKTQTISTASLVAGQSFLFTLTSCNTLETITDTVGIQLGGTDKGDWDVLYEFQVLAGGDILGS
jgi:hypothetical protein